MNCSQFSSLKEKACSILKQESATSNQLTLQVTKLYNYLDFKYSDNTLPDLFAEAIILIFPIRKSSFEETNIKLILNRMFTFCDLDFSNAFAHIDGHDIEILFQDRDCDEDFCILYDVEDIIDRLYPATKQYAHFSKTMDFYEKINITRLAFLLNQFLYNPEIQELLKRQEIDCQKLKEQVTKK